MEAEKKLFRQARQNRVFQDVVDQIQDAILTGKLAPGTRLPPERELKEMFNTSRGTLREALRVLEQKGLIEIRLGVSGGSIVKQMDTEPVAESLALLIRSGDVSLAHLSEFRILVEGSLVTLATRRATPTHIARLNQMLEEAAQYYATGDLENFLKTDEALHAYIGVMTRNPMFQFIQKTLHDNIHRYYQDFLPVDSDWAGENLADLQKIVAAMAAGDSDTAAAIIQNHVRHFHEIMSHETPTLPLSGTAAY